MTAKSIFKFTKYLVATTFTLGLNFSAQAQAAVLIQKTKDGHIAKCQNTEDIGALIYTVTHVELKHETHKTQNFDGQVAINLSFYECEKQNGKFLVTPTAPGAVRKRLIEGTKIYLSQLDVKNSTLTIIADDMDSNFSEQISFANKASQTLLVSAPAVGRYSIAVSGIGRSYFGNVEYVESGHLLGGTYILQVLP